MKILVGKKLRMTRIFTEDGIARAVTAVEAKPTEVFEIKEKEKNGYESVKVKVENRKKSKFVEFRSENEEKAFKTGDKIGVDQFEVGDKVTIVAKSKGKGFAGTIKRYGFAQGPKSHGSNQQRRVGSIGAAYPQHVLKGQRMPGHMGSDRITVKNLEIVDVDASNQILLIAGAIPGMPGTEIKITAN
jgi:large subunit ribosomal protein L3